LNEDLTFNDKDTYYTYEDPDVTDKVKEKCYTWRTRTSSTPRKTRILHTKVYSAFHPSGVGSVNEYQL